MYNSLLRVVFFFILDIKHHWLKTDYFAGASTNKEYLGYCVYLRSTEACMDLTHVGFILCTFAPLIS